jgi:predicted ATP-grasp superfamily ATP-dependent carboligase
LISTPRSGPGDVPALILGNGITALGVQRILADARLPYFSVEKDDPFVVRSRYYRPLPHAGARVEPENIDTWLSRLPLSRAVLIPCADAWVRAVADLSPELRHRFPASIASLDAIERLVDKGRFAETLMGLGVPHPRSRSVSSAAELHAVLAEGFEEAFLKPRDSGSFFRVFGQKAFRARNADELAGRLAEVQNHGLEVIVQEYVPGPPSNHVFIDGFRDRNGVIRALFARRRLRMYPPLFGNSTSMKSVPVEEAREAADQLAGLLDHVDYRGVFSAEFKQDTTDGRFKLLEVNTRPWWYVEFAARCGVDVCSMAYRDALGEPVESVDSYRTGAVCVYPYMDYFACRELLRAGELSPGEWIRSWAGAVQPVFRRDDPWPAVRATAGILSGKVRGARRAASESSSKAD